MRGEFVDLDGARVYYYAAGTRGAGDPVILIHGFPTSSHLWSDVVPLMPPGHRIVVLDLLGFGRSDRPQGRAVDVAAHAHRLVALLDELHIERACVVGHGMGGGVAQALAARHGERVSHICLVDSVALDGRESLHAGITRAAMPVAQLLPFAALNALLRRDLLRGYDDPARGTHSVDLYLRPFASSDGRDALVAALRAGKKPTGVDARGIKAPTSIVWGENDRAIPLSVGIRLRDAIPGARLTVIPGAKHFTPEERPREIADAIAALLHGMP